MKARNAVRYKADKTKWELKYAIRRIYITKNRSGSRAQFKHDEDTGAYVVKKGREGINWYNYQEKILKHLLLLFAKECLKTRPGTFVLKDNALSHAARY